MPSHLRFSDAMAHLAAGGSVRRSGWTAGAVMTADSGPYLFFTEDMTAEDWEVVAPAEFTYQASPELAPQEEPGRTVFVTPDRRQYDRLKRACPELEAIYPLASLVYDLGPVYRFVVLPGVDLGRRLSDGRTYEWVLKSRQLLHENPEFIQL